MYYEKKKRHVHIYCCTGSISILAVMKDNACDHYKLYLKGSI